MLRSLDLIPKLLEGFRKMSNRIYCVFKRSSGFSRITDLKLFFFCAWVYTWRNLKQKYYMNLVSFLKNIIGTSLMAQWLRIRLPMQGTWVRALVQEDLTCCGATKPMRYNY